MIEVGSDLALVKTFNDRQRDILRNAGAVTHLPEGQTIKDQMEAGKRVEYTANAGCILGGFRSRLVEVAFYPASNKFFIPNSFNKTRDEQDILIEQEAEKLRRRPGLEGVTIRRPQASEATGVLFWYFDQEKIRLLGEDYKDQSDGELPTIITCTPTNNPRTRFATVGRFVAGKGPSVSDWSYNKPNKFCGVAFWVVPI